VRAGCAMPGMSRQGTAGRQEHALMASHGRDIAVTAVAVVLTAVVFAAVAGHGVLARIQHLDDAWLRLMISSRSGPVTAVAMFLNVLGLGCYEDISTVGGESRYCRAGGRVFGWMLTEAGVRGSGVARLRRRARAGGVRCGRVADRGSGGGRRCRTRTAPSR